MESIEEIKKALGYRKLVMNRVPINTFNRFEKIANTEDFCNDRGMALKLLLDFYEGLVPIGTEHIDMRLDALELELAKLKEQISKKQEEKKTITTISGKSLKR